MKCFKIAIVANYDFFFSFKNKVWELNTLSRLEALGFGKEYC